MSDDEYEEELEKRRQESVDACEEYNTGEDNNDYSDLSLDDK